MSTKAEQVRAEEQRTKAHRKPKAGAAPKPARTRTRANGRANGTVAGKATYAYEAPHPGKPSRKSTRKSANRSKPDSNLTAREALQKGSPEARFRRARDKETRARGSTH